ncbi:MAG: cytochrome C oxidase subunit IV family protein [Acidobacteriaceae bacterium]|jgi:cytochrome c oxidase subunit 4|nr:cytochrome C oxidase subunit IV family protein [Acidobacteriaceae bacterium]
MTPNEPVVPDVRRYLLVFAALLVLTIVTVAISALDLGRHAAIAIAIGIATVKASLVAMVFMHLSHERRWLLWSMGAIGIFILGLLFWPAWDIAERLSR